MNNPLKYIDPTGNMAVFEVGSPTEDLGNGATAIITNREIDELNDMIKKDSRLSSSDKKELKDSVNSLRKNYSDIKDKIKEDSDLLDELRAKGKISDEAWRAADGMMAYRIDSGSAEAVPFYKDPAFVVPFAITFVAAGGVNATVTFLNDATTYIYVKAQIGLGRLLDRIGKGSKGIDKIELPKLKFTQDQLQKKFKHAAHFGIEGNFNKANAQLFKDAITNHVNNATDVFKSTYRGQDVFVHLKEGLGVYTDMSGEYISGWKFTIQQLQYHLQNGIRIK